MYITAYSFMHKIKPYGTFITSEDINIQVDYERLDSKVH